MNKKQLPFRFKLKLQGANLVFTVFASDKYDAMKTVQEEYPSASVISAQGSEEILGERVQQW